MRGDAVWAAWSEDALWVQGRDPEGRGTPERLSRRMLAEHRYFLRLYRSWDRRLWLRSGHGQETVLEVAAGGGFQPLPGWPGELAALPPYRVVPLPDGTVAGLPEDVSRLLLWRPGAPPVSRALPDGFLARAVTRERHGRLWVAGSVPTARSASASRRHALAMSADEGRSWLVSEASHGQLLVSWFSYFLGAETEYRTVDAVGDQLVVTSEAGDVEHSSTLVFIRGGEHERWRGRVLRDDVFRAALGFEDGHVEVVSHSGRMLRLEQGHRWRPSDLTPRIRQALRGVEPALPSDARFEILSADASPPGERRLLVVSVRAPQRGMARVGEAVIVLAADGDETCFFQGAPGRELITACFGG